MRTRYSLIAVVVLAGMLVVPPVHAATVTARQLLGKLPVKAENNAGYERERFTHWSDADSDGCDTRAEVLIAESTVAVTRNSYCTVLTGRWVSVFDGEVWTRASDVDIDHHVALAEAWGSGARGWSSTQRMRYANDLGYPWSLNAMTDNLNASKSDRDPATWLPPQNACKYVIRWMSVKYRWRLTIDNAEKGALSDQLSGSCGSKVVKLPKKAPTDPGTGGGGGGGNCDPAYPTVCIPPPPPDLDCGQVAFTNFRVLAPDPHNFDSDGDGVGCET